MISTSAERPSLTAAQAAAALCLDLKANDVVILDLEGVSDMTDCFVIASGSSDTHVRAIAEHVAEEMKKRGFEPHHLEGLTQGRWARSWTLSISWYTSFIRPCGRSTNWNASGGMRRSSR